MFTHNYNATLFRDIKLYGIIFVQIVVLAFVRCLRTLETSYVRQIKERVEEIVGISEIITSNTLCIPD